MPQTFLSLKLMSDGKSLNFYEYYMEIHWKLVEICRKCEKYARWVVFLYSLRRKLLSFFSFYEWDLNTIDFYLDKVGCFVLSGVFENIFIY